MYIKGPSQDFGRNDPISTKAIEFDLFLNDIESLRYI